MGDRANVLVLDEYDETADPVVLYTHWGGYELPQALARALDSKAGRGRWSDGPYLTRIIFGDNEHPLLVVDVKAQEIRVIAEGDFARARDPEAATKRFSFAEFAENGATLWGGE